MQTPEGLTASHDRELIRLTIETGDGENRFSPEMTRWLTGLLDGPPAEARVLVVDAQGVNFCLGPKPAALTDQTVRELGTSLAGLNRALARTSLITIAQIDGVAAGFGVGLACLPDFTIAGDSASFVLPEVIHNLTPALVLSWLPEYVGPKTAAWLTLTGLPVDAQQAVALGLASRAVPSPELDTEVTGLVGHLNGLEQSTVSEIKRFLRDRQGLPLRGAEDLAIERMGAWADRATT